MKVAWTIILVIYLLTIIPAGFMALAAFGERNVDLSGDAQNAFRMLAAYLIGIPVLLLIFKPRFSSHGPSEESSNA